MTLISKSSFLLALVLVLSLVEAGVVSNESQSVSVSSSSSITKSKLKEEAKKPSARGAKVLYTAPYSSVRVSSKSEQMKPSSHIPPKFRSLSSGPVLIRKGEEKPTTTTTTPTTTTPTTTPVPVILVDLVTEEQTPESSAASVEIDTDPTTVTPKAA